MRIITFAKNNKKKNGMGARLDKLQLNLLGRSLRNSKTVAKRVLNPRSLYDMQRAKGVINRVEKGKRRATKQERAIVIKGLKRQASLVVPGLKAKGYFAANQGIEDARRMASRRNKNK